MKILFGLSSFYPEHTAGTETYVLNLAKELKKKGIETCIAFPSAGKNINNYTYDGIDVYPFFVPLKISTKEMNGLAKVSGIEQFEKILDETKPDIFHLHSLSRSFHAEHIKLAKQKGIKTVFTAHLGGTFCVSGDLQLFQKKQCNALVKKQRCLACFIKKQKKYNIFISSIIAFLINILLKTPLKYKFPALNIVNNKLNQLKRLQKYSDCNIAIAKWIKYAFNINKIKNVEVVEQGINKQFKESKKLSKKNKKIELIFIGRMHPDKGIHILLDAIEDFIDKFNLTIVTIPFKDEMTYYQKIKRQYENLGFNKWFENLSQQQVSEILNDKDMLILPSTANEAAPLVILEAFTKKIPVLGSSYIAIKEMVKHNYNGLIFQNGDVDSLKEQLKNIANQPKILTKFSKNINEQRSFIDVANDMTKIYQNLS